MRKFLLFLGSLFLCSFLVACSTPTKIAGYRVDTSTNSIGQNSRVRHIVLHYTVSDTPSSINILTKKNVSSHYLITDDQPPKLYQFVPEDRRAWHAGVSQWHDNTDLNTSSIGIEIVNAGRQEDGSWAEYHPAQIEMLKALLHDVVERHRVTPGNIVGHSDIAPQRKIDPGPLFPWTQLANDGLGRWYNETAAQSHQLELEQNGLPDDVEIQLLLKKAGYAVPLHGQWDKASQNVMSVFQMHYRPSQHDGQPDAQSIAILKALRE